MSNQTVHTHSIGFPGLLTILFIALKLMGYINWSWVWVLSPLWISFSIAAILLIGVVLTAMFWRD